ncbi:hypothetical protein CEXT_257551 [Caerostris extrusa]|uniref:Uncharacterized protein n=1 Tax=Caerostris extrusa TaxID=172846 RepID=A0AAV4UG73_CAEEX|nr:hypothetical protein CEXT_257551 [Caerostris extrusa]
MREGNNAIQCVTDQRLRIKWRRYLMTSLFTVHHRIIGCTNHTTEMRERVIMPSSVTDQRLRIKWRRYLISTSLFTVHHRIIGCTNHTTENERG